MIKLKEIKHEKVLTSLIRAIQEIIDCLEGMYTGSHNLVR